MAANLDCALTRWRAAPYDLVLADLSLPDADGRTSCAPCAPPTRTAAAGAHRARRRQLALWALAPARRTTSSRASTTATGWPRRCCTRCSASGPRSEAHGYLLLARGLLDALDAPTCAVGPDGLIVAANAAWREYVTGSEEAGINFDVGGNYLVNCDALAASGTELALPAQDGADGLRRLLTGQVQRFQQEFARPGGTTGRWFTVRMTPVELESGRGAVISHVDVTEMHLVQLELAHQAVHDTLTGLPNRVLLSDRLQQACADARRRGRRVGVAFVDLDHFKRVNDSLGHAAGDALLLQVAARLAVVTRAGDTLSRYSGDEFVMVWRDLAPGDDVSAMATRVLTALSDPFDLGESSVNLSASVGVAVGGAGEGVAGSADELLMAADAAMYDAKRHGGARLRNFSAELREEIVELMTTEVDLRTALERSGLTVHYQPVIDLATGRPVAVEALARWEHATRGMIPRASSSRSPSPAG